MKIKYRCVRGVETRRALRPEWQAVSDNSPESAFALALAKTAGLAGADGGDLFEIVALEVEDPKPGCGEVHILRRDLCNVRGTEAAIRKTLEVGRGQTSLGAERSPKIGAIEDLVGGQT